MRLELNNSSGIPVIAVEMESPRYVKLLLKPSDAVPYISFADGEVLELARWARALAAALEGYQERLTVHVPEEETLKGID